MKSLPWIVTLAASLLSSVPALAAVVESYSQLGLNTLIPDGNPSGLSQSQTITLSSIRDITSVSVTLSIGTPVDGDSTFNGDLYAYLQHGSGLSILLNRPGATAGNPFGYSDNGIDVTFADGAANGDIHNYGTLTGSLTPESPLTGVWEPDARTDDPNIVTENSARVAFLNSLNGLDANGTWTLFVADLSSGGSAMLSGYSIQITGNTVPSVPEMGVHVATSLVLALIFMVVLRHRSPRSKSESN